MAISFSIIVAVDQKFGIGKNGKLPWQLSADLKHFREVTTSASAGKMNAVLMGRKTWESLPEKFRPLPQRINVVISRNPDLPLPYSVFKAPGLDQALALIEKELAPQVEDVFVIGGAQLYAEALRHPACRRVYLTRITHTFDCDAFFPDTLPGFKKISESAPLREKDLFFSFQVHAR